MMINRFKSYIVAGLVSCGSAAALTACTDWDNHYETAADGAAGGALWEQLSSNPQLTDFCQVLEKTRVFRMHRKTEVSYADLLRGGQSFTVMAPVNGTFNRDSLLALVETAQGDSMVEKTFVFNHLSRMATSLKSVPQTMRLLNGKNAALTQTTIQGVPVLAANQHAENGVLHIVSHALPYSYNLYEALCDDLEMTPAGLTLRHYEWDSSTPMHLFQAALSRVCPSMSTLSSTSATVCLRESAC